MDRCQNHDSDKSLQCEECKSANSRNIQEIYVHNIQTANFWEWIELFFKEESGMYWFVHRVKGTDGTELTH